MDGSNRVRELLEGGDQKLAWDYFVLRVVEYLESGFKGRMVVDISRGRIEVVLDQAAIAGVTQLTYYMNRTRERLTNTN